MVTLLLDARISLKEVYEITNHPDIEVMFGAAGPPTMENVKKALTNPNNAVCLAKAGELTVGFIAIRYMKVNIVQLSGGFISGFRGKAAKDAITHFIDLLFKNGVIKIVGEVLPENKQCLVMARTLGFKREGVNRASIIVGNRLVDQIYVGLTIGDWNGRDVRRRT